MGHFLIQLIASYTFLKVSKMGIGAEPVGSLLSHKNVSVFVLFWFSISKLPTTFLIRSIEHHEPIGFWPAATNARKGIFVLLLGSYLYQYSSVSKCRSVIDASFLFENDRWKKNKGECILRVHHTYSTGVSSLFSMTIRSRRLNKFPS